MLTTLMSLMALKMVGDGVRTRFSVEFSVEQWRFGPIMGCVRLSCGSRSGKLRCVRQIAAEKAARENAKAAHTFRLCDGGSYSERKH